MKKPIEGKSWSIDFKGLRLLVTCEPSQFKADYHQIQLSGIAYQGKMQVQIWKHRKALFKRSLSQPVGNRRPKTFFVQVEICYTGSLNIYINTGNGLSGCYLLALQFSDDWQGLDFEEIDLVS